MKHSLITLFFLSLIFLTACNKTKSDIPFEIEPVYDFRTVDKIALHDSEKVDTEEIGISSISIIDSIMIIKHIDRWSVLSLSGHSYGDVLHIGDDPDGLSFIPFPGVTTLQRGDSLVFIFPDNNKQKIFRFNLSKFLNDRDSKLTRTDAPLLNNLTWNTVALNDDSFLLNIPTSDFNKQERMIMYGDSIRKLALPYDLDALHVTDPNDFNILSRINGFKPEVGRVVEASVMLNHINVYSPDGAFCKSVSIGSPVSPSDVVNIPAEERKITFIDLSMWKEGFGVLTNKDLIEKKSTENETGMSYIFLFDWNLKPVAQLAIDSHIKSFDMDLDNDMLYFVTSDTDEIHKISIPKIYS